MKKLFKRAVAASLVLGMALQFSEAGIAFAADEANKALNPAEQIALTVPETLQDGNNYVFIRESMFEIGEKSSEKLYIPIQRTGDISGEAEVTLKLVDITSRIDENYTAEIYKENVDPTIDKANVSVIDLVVNGDGQVEEEPPTDDEIGALINEAGGADVVDADGNALAKITADKVDENGEAVGDIAAQDSAQAQVQEPETSAVEMVLPEDQTEEVTDAAETAAPAPTQDTAAKGTSALMQARNAWTGTISDRQELEHEDEDGFFPAANGETGKPSNLVEDQYPGREFRLHFGADEEAKFLVLTPKYSPAADGDCQLILLLKDQDENLVFPADMEPTPVNIKDEDERETVTVSMASPVVYAQDGIAEVTVTREGRINSMVGVRIASWEGSAKVGEDYGGVGAKLYFPFGITQRTIKLPVQAGTEEKDFYVNISPITDVEIGAEATRVVIPAAGTVSGGEGSLMDDEGSSAPEPLNIKTGLCSSDLASFVSDSTFKLRTRDNQVGSYAYADFRVPFGYLYDGVTIDSQMYANFCRPHIGVDELDFTFSGEYTNKYTDDNDEEGIRPRQQLNYYYGSPEAPYSVRVITSSRWNDGYPWTDDYCELTVYGVTPIKRSFTITVEPPEALEFEGISSEQVLKEYESYVVNDNLNSVFTIKSNDSFAISRAGTSEMARLVGIEAVNSDGETKRIATIDGSSSTAVVELSEGLVNTLAREGYIRWNKEEGEGDPKANQSYSGSFTVRPVFDYVSDVTVEVPQSTYGTLTYNGGKKLEPGTYTFHHGDKLTFSTELSETGKSAKMLPSGYKYTAKTSKENETVKETEETYINGTTTVPLTLNYNYYNIAPTFTEEENRVVVKIADSDVQYFNPEFGLFKDYVGETWSADGYTYYPIAENILTNQVYELWAATNDDSYVPIWNLPASDTVYSGQAFYLMSGTKAEDNLVTLSVEKSENNAYYSISGSVYTSTYNLNTGHSATDMVPAQDAMITAGLSGAMTDQDGNFTLPVQYAAGGSTIRYTVTYNGSISIKEAKLYAANMPKKEASYARTVADASAPGGKRVESVKVSAINMNVGSVPVDGIPQSGAHFKNASVTLRGFVPNVISAVEMNGKELEVTAEVEPGQDYVFGQQMYKESVKGVTFFFKNQTTGIVHGIYSTDNSESGATWDAETNTAKLKIDKFAPNDPNSYTYGDVLMVQLRTDKKVGLAGYSGTDMVYDPVSTGIGVMQDQNYVPQTFDFNIESFAAMMGATPPSNIDDEGKMMEEGTRSSFGRFPFLGEITAMVYVYTSLVGSKYSKLANEFLEDIEDDQGNVVGSRNIEGLHGGDDEGARNNQDTQISVAFRIQETTYGGTRFVLGVVFTHGDSLYDKNAGSYNRSSSRSDGFASRRRPFTGMSYAWDMLANTRYREFNKKSSGSANSIEYIYNKATGGGIMDNFGGPYFTFSIMFGIYLDYGYVEIQKTDGSNKTEISHDMVFMGGGGVYSLMGTVGFNFPFYIPVIVIPAYINAEAGANANIYLGSSADPNLTLARFDETGKLHGQDFAFNVEVMGGARASLSIGIGWYKLLGARLTGGVEFELGWSKNMKKWFPSSGSEFGYGMDATFSGTVDLVVTSIDLFSYSWPTGVQGGWMSYFREVRRANNMIKMIRKKVTKGKGTEAVRKECTRMADDLAKLVDSKNDAFEQMIKEKTQELKRYAYDNDMIDWVERNRIDMNKSEGIIGNIMDGVHLQEDGDAEMPIFRTRDHVASEFVANKGGSLFGTQKEKGSQKIVEDAAEQTSSRIMSLEYTDGAGVKQNENKYLVTYLADDSERTRQQALTLVYTIYDANTDTWTMPEAVQDDGTADGKPNLIDAGDKLVLSWSSMTADKYKKLRDTVSAEVKAKSGVNDEPMEEDIDNALEAAPTRIMEQMDIFSVTFDKKSMTLGNIDQLTDDEYYDDYPEAVYDDKTGDYIVLYYKTAQDTEDYTSENDRLKALMGVSPDPTKTYSVLCYMLYNNQTDAEDVNGEMHQPGWARSYVFANETDVSDEALAEHLKTWKGQRFLTSTIKTSDGGQADPPIGDLTAANGYNGLAAFAFTVDTDFNLNTAEDKELYVQFYDFDQHKTYFPVKIAGETTEQEFVDGSTIERTKAVDVGTPQLIRNDGSTWLFWRENNDGLRYLNISELMNARVAKSADVLTKFNNDSEVTEDELDYAVKEDGTFATDPHTGKPYQPNIQKVDLKALNTSDDLDVSEYKVITDKDDNLYLVWTDIHTYTEGEGEDETQYAAQEIYASALIKEQVNQNGETVTTSRWSKPNKLTTNKRYNDGLAIALDKDGGLIIVHNQYSKLAADSEEKVRELVNKGKMRLIENEDGTVYMQGSLLYDSPTDLMVTRFEETGSLKATLFGLSDETPQPGDTVKVTAFVENTGITNAYGIDAEFYEYKDGVRGKKIFEAKDDDLIAVNNSAQWRFDWTVPGEGIDGYKIQAVIKEKKSDGTYYEPLESYSYEFVKAPEFELEKFDIEQDGDDFVLSYKINNTGNDKTADGTTLNLRLSLLHSHSYDSEEMYGVEDDLLWSKDISGLEPSSSDEDEVKVRIPASVFKKFGYDAVRLSIEDADSNEIDSTDDVYIKLDAPLNIRLHDGEDMQVTVGETASAALTYDSNVFLDGEIDVRYSVDDPSIASVDAEGNVTAAAEGETNLNATILPSGETVSVKLKATLSDVVPAIVGAHLDGANAEFTLENADAEGEVQAIAAWYDENGKLLGVKKEAVTVTGTNMNISLPISTEGAKSVKVMAWRDDNSPIAEADVVAVN